MNAAIESGVIFELNADQIDMILTNVVPFATYDGVHSVIAGVNLAWDTHGNFKACATDGSRLALFENHIGVGAQENLDVTVPVALFEALSKVWRKKTRGNIRFGVLQNKIAFKSDKIDEQQFDLIPGTYPRYSELFPRDYKHVLELLPVKEDRFSKEKSATGYSLGDLALEINQVRKLSPAVCVWLTAQHGDANMKVRVKGTKHWHFDATIDGLLDYGSIDICFNPKYLADVLSGMSGAVRIQMNGKDKPAVFTSLGTHGLRHLLMPVQTK